MTLLQRSLVLVAIALLPAVLIQGFNEYSLRTTREAEVRAESLRQADGAARDVARLFEGVKNLLVALSLVPDVAGGNKPACDELFRRVTESESDFLNVATADADGRIVCSAIPPRRAISAVGRPYFRALETNAFTVGEYTVGLSVNAPVLQLAHPLRDGEGRATGVIWIALRLNELQQHLSGISLGAGATLTVADRNGTILAQTPDASNVGMRLPDPVAALQKSGRPGWHEGRDPGTGRITVYAYMPVGVLAQDVSVIYAVDRAAAFAPIEQATLRGSLLIALGIALSVLFAVFSAKRFIREPVANLLGTLDTWLKGNYAARAPVLDKRSEMGRLASTFNALAETVGQREADLRRSEGEFRTIFEFAGRGKVVTDPKSGKLLRMNRAFCEMLGFTRDELLNRTIAEITHPDHHEEDRAALSRLMRGDDTSFDREKRYIRKDGQVIWARANVVVLRDGTGEATHAIGVVEDITDRKAANERLKLLAAEVDHRAKNMLAAVMAITRMTRAATVEGFAEALAGRFLALSRAHTLLSESRWTGAGLERLLDEELEAYRGGGRVSTSGPSVALGPAVAQSVAMTIHELATNAAKYGALSVPAGRVAVSWSRHTAEQLTLRWVESGGPPVVKPARYGFGTSLVTTMIEKQLGGSVCFEWHRDGLVCELAVPIS